MWSRRVGNKGLAVQGPYSDLAIITSSDAATLVRGDCQTPAFSVILSHVSLDTVLSREIPYLDESVLAGGYQKMQSFLRALDSDPVLFLACVDGRQEMDRGDLVLVTSQFEKTNLCHQVPQDHICVLGATGQPHAGIIKPELSHSRLVPVEDNDHGGESRIPYSDLTIVVANSEQIFVFMTLGDSSHLANVSLVRPTTQQLSGLDIPTQDIFVGPSNSGSRS